MAKSKNKQKTEEKKYNLKNDIIFKTFFSRKGNEKFLIDFLSGLLKVEIKNIKIIGEANLLQLSQDEKGGRLDVQAELDNGTIINVEMQMKDEKNISSYFSFIDVNWTFRLSR